MVRSLLLLLAGLSLSQVGCKARESSPEPRLVIFAAASLREAFTALGEDFRAAHPGVELTFNFAGTQALRTQLEQGAAADLFASADLSHMQALEAAGRVRGAVVFARNEPVLVISRERAATLTRFEELPTADRVVLGALEVPIGRYTAELLARAGGDFQGKVEAKVVSRELNVRQVLNKVSLGEAEAGVVYRTDALSAAGRVSVVSIPPGVNVLAAYPVAVINGAAHPELAAAFQALLLSEAGQKALRAAGFLAPEGAAP